MFVFHVNCHDIAVQLLSMGPDFSIFFIHETPPTNYTVNVTIMLPRFSRNLIFLFEYLESWNLLDIIENTIFNMTDVKA